MTWRYRECEECGEQVALLLAHDTTQICRSCFTELIGENPGFGDLAWYGAPTIMLETWLGPDQEGTHNA